MSYSYDSYLNSISRFIEALLPFLFILIVISVIIGLFCALCLWKIFKKAGKPGWAAIVPFYNSYVLYEICWGSGWLFVLEFLPVVSTAIQIMTLCKLADAFGKGAGFSIGLFLLPIAFLPILAFDDSIVYIGVRDMARCAGCTACRQYPPHAQHTQKRYGPLCRMYGLQAVSASCAAYSIP